MEPCGCPATSTADQLIRRASSRLWEIFGSNPAFSQSSIQSPKLKINFAISQFKTHLTCPLAGTRNYSRQKKVCPFSSPTGFRAAEIKQMMLVLKSLFFFLRLVLDSEKKNIPSPEETCHRTRFKGVARFRTGFLSMNS